MESPRNHGIFSSKALRNSIICKGETTESWNPEFLWIPKIPCDSFVFLKFEIDFNEILY
jgi:hypothetical protein